MRSRNVYWTSAFVYHYLALFSHHLTSSNRVESLLDSLYTTSSEDFLRNEAFSFSVSISEKMLESIQLGDLPSLQSFPFLCLGGWPTWRSVKCQSRFLFECERITFKKWTNTDVPDRVSFPSVTPFCRTSLSFLLQCQQAEPIKERNWESDLPMYQSCRRWSQPRFSIPRTLKTSHTYIVYSSSQIKMEAGRRILLNYSRKLS